MNDTNSQNQIDEYEIKYASPKKKSVYMIDRTYSIEKSTFPMIYVLKLNHSHICCKLAHIKGIAYLIDLNSNVGRIRLTNKQYRRFSELTARGYSINCKQIFKKIKL